ncbi:Secretory protein [Aphelenchoides bicaudatus]|nr:Secretory protein [Aphelenchoides bicaudatus]
MKTLFILALCIAATLAENKTIVFVTTDQPYKITSTWDPEIISDDILMPLLYSFFYSYHNMVDKYNKDALQNITWYFDPNYDGVAYASNGGIVFATSYFKDRADARVAMHESMHIVQAYPDFSTKDGWLVEGIADYGRAEFGGNYNFDDYNDKALPDYAPSQSYTDGYGVTAAFLKYLENSWPGIVLKLNTANQDKSYNSNTWNSITGKSVEQLWSDYANASTSNGKAPSSLCQV